MPFVGQIVLVYDTKRAGFDGSIPNPAIVTRVHSETVVNAKVLANVSPSYDAEEISSEVGERYWAAI